MAEAARNSWGTACHAPLNVLGAKTKSSANAWAEHGREEWPPAL